MYTAKFDFQKDFDEMLIAELADYNLHLNPSDTSENIRQSFFNFKRRLVDPKPRKVLISDVFECPENLQAGLEIIKGKINEGEDITPHLSKNIFRLDYNDSLLNDWKIYHLHLGEMLEDNSKFIERTGPVLFVRFDNENAYFINVLNHGSWTKQHMVKTIHDNWPESIKSYLFNGVIGLDHVPTDEDIKSFRKYGVNSAVEVAPQVIYAPIGGGLTTAKTSVEVSIAMINYNRLLKQLEDWIKENLQEIGNKVSERFNEIPNELIIKLVIEDGNFYALETQSQIAFNLGKH